MTPLLNRVGIPGLFVTGTDTGVGKTLVAGAIARWFVRRGARPGVCKIAATGCAHRREGWVSEDAEFLAQCAESPFPLDIICPQRFIEPLAPAVAAQRANKLLDWSAIQRSLTAIAAASDCMIVEGVGGILVPMDEKHTVLDVAKWLQLPTLIVARPSLGTINHTLLTIESLRSANVKIAGVVINRYPTDVVGTAEETSPRWIERFGRTPVLCLVPDAPGEISLAPPEDVMAAIEQVDWTMKMR
jgi:dethiobiotin synthetase